MVITGANTGVGFETARILASRGAEVVLACRDPQRADQARKRIASQAPSARLDTLTVDLASLTSVRSAAAELRSRHPNVDVLVNNAGVMWGPQRADGGRLRNALRTNHLGHFAFTGLVLDLLLPVAGSRVVVLSSPAHHAGDIDFDDLAYRERYRPNAAYSRSKLANLLFAQLLQAKLSQAGVPTIAVAAHPGGARTELNRHMPWMFRGPSWGLARPITHPADVGALSLVRGAVDPDITGERTSDQADGASSPDIPSCSSPATEHAIWAWPNACGRSPNSSPASATTSPPRLAGDGAISPARHIFSCRSP